MNIRQIKEQREQENLSPFAVASAASQGRSRPVAECEIRTCFERDRDRIIHSKSFRRLKHKTQVFLSPEGDHYRTRLTHTLEVTQIARVIARALNMNEDLTEAIALGHDIGHTPFGHLGEYLLDSIMDGGFDHALQSLRTVEVLEPLNLTKEVRDGIANHNGDKERKTLEAQIVHLADRTAYINHDLDDAIRGSVLQKSDIPSSIVNILGTTSSARIDCIVKDIVKHSLHQDSIHMSTPVYEAMHQLRAFLFARVYSASAHFKQLEDTKARLILKSLFDYYCEHIHEMPAQFRQIAESDSAQRGVADYISGMTDRYAIKKYTELFIPSFWS